MTLSIANRRLLPLLILASFATFLWVFRTNASSPVQKKIYDLPQTGQSIGLGDDSASNVSPAGSAFGASHTKPLGKDYSRILVIPRTSKENISWALEGIPELETAVYVVDDPSAPLHPPKNKGNEVMVYLSYIIDFWDRLPDVSIFMHAHRFAWHNNELLENDSLEMLRRLSSERIVRDGYVNLRCHWDPGCPDWIRPGANELSDIKKEQKVMARSWPELFPSAPIPKVLGVPCCAQFALSKDRIRSLPLDRYKYLRDWLLRSSLSDSMTGRVFEYTWHYIFTSRAVECPAMNVCYCDLYGVCFGDEEKFNKWFELRYHRREAEKELKKWKHMEATVLVAKEKGQLDESVELEVPELGKNLWLNDDIRKWNSEMDSMLEAAKKAGDNPANRAREAGRQWKEGDGF